MIDDKLTIKDILQILRINRNRLLILEYENYIIRITSTFEEALLVLIIEKMLERAVWHTITCQWFDLNKNFKESGSQIECDCMQSTVSLLTKLHMN